LKYVSIYTNSRSVGIQSNRVSYCTLPLLPKIRPNSIFKFKFKFLMKLFNLWVQVQSQNLSLLLWLINHLLHRPIQNWGQGSSNLVSEFIPPLSSLPKPPPLIFLYFFLLICFRSGIQSNRVLYCTPPSQFFPKFALPHFKI